MAKENLNNLINQASKSLNTDAETVEQAAKSGDYSQILKNMNPNDAKKIQSILNDKSATEKILASDQAKEIINKIFGK